MTSLWSRLVGSGPSGPDYWEYFGRRLVEHAGIRVGARVLDVGCGAGSSLFASIERIGRAGSVTGIDICPH
jgi:O-methyltransferase/aklanonic acid methyltransferase